jgi:acyl-CoA reductase-like NAD-dependent aldehyde dehydrogenase
MPDGAGIPVENPATGETIATVPELGAEEVRGLVAAARAAQPDGDDHGAGAADRLRDRGGLRSS